MYMCRCYSGCYTLFFTVDDMLFFLAFCLPTKGNTEVTKTYIDNITTSAWWKENETIKKRVEFWIVRLINKNCTQELWKHFIVFFSLLLVVFFFLFSVYTYANGIWMRLYIWGSDSRLYFRHSVFLTLCCQAATLCVSSAYILKLLTVIFIYPPFFHYWHCRLLFVMLHQNNRNSRANKWQ